MRAIRTFLTLTHLTPYTTKTYITILPQNTHLLINSYSHLLRNLSAKSGPIYPKQTQFAKYSEKNYEKRTQFQSALEESDMLDPSPAQLFTCSTFSPLARRTQLQSKIDNRNSQISYNSLRENPKLSKIFKKNQKIYLL